MEERGGVLYIEIDGLIKELRKEEKAWRDKGKDGVAKIFKELRSDLTICSASSSWFVEDNDRWATFCHAMCVLLYWRMFGDEDV